MEPKAERMNFQNFRFCPASILYKSIAGRYRPVSYPDGPITARYRFIKNAYWTISAALRVVTVSLKNSQKVLLPVVFFLLVFLCY